MNFPPGQRARLGSAAELWDPVPGNYEGHDEVRVVMNTMVRQLSGGPDRMATDGEVAGELYAALLEDLVVAAGGVEHAVERFLGEVRRLQEYATGHGFRSTTETVQGIGSAEGAWYALADVMSWARIVDERLERQPPPRSGLRRQGLLPALTLGTLRSRVHQLRSDCVTGPFGEVRVLANFTVHAALIRSPHAGATVDTAGRVRLSFPDRSPQRIVHVSTLCFSEHRDAVTFTTDLWTTIKGLVDEVLTAFWEATPNRP